MQGLAPCILNMVVIKVGEQNPMDMVELHSQLDNLFEYIHHELSAHGFRDCVKRFMKFEKSRFKKWYQKDGQTGCPFGVDAYQWATFVKYWEEHNTQKKTSQLTCVRVAFTKLSKYSRCCNLSLGLVTKVRAYKGACPRMKPRSHISCSWECGRM